jgi:arylsulfatase A-like enzyme
VLQLSVDRAADRRPFSGAVWGDPTLLARASARPRNVLLVSVDPAGAASVGAAGCARTPSAFLDMLAAEGARFDGAPATSALQAHLSLFSAVDASAHDLMDLRDGRVGEGHATMAELFRAAGYATAALSDGGLPATRGFERGFDRYLDADRHPRAEDPLRAASQWIGEHRREPFFLFVHTRAAYDAGDAPATELAATDGANTAIAADLQHCDAATEAADDRLTALWREVRRLGLADATVAVALFGAGGAPAVRNAALHDGRAADATLLGPLVIRAPGLVAPHTRVARPVGLVDVLPTVLDLVRLPAVERAEGRSLLASLDGRNTDAAEAASAPSP